MSNNVFYVYQYLRDDNVPYYIGKGSNNRINESHGKWIEVPPTDRRQIIQHNMSEAEAFSLELELINKYGRKIDGGILDNVKLSRWVSQAGWNHTETAKEYISIKNTGKVRTAEHKQKYSLAKQRMSSETKDKIRLANIGRTDDGRNATISATMKGRPWSEARRLAQQQRAKGI